MSFSKMRSARYHHPTSKSKLEFRNGRAGDWPSDCHTNINRGGGAAALSSEAVRSWTASNRTLLSYLYQSSYASNDPEARTGWRGTTNGCDVVPLGCWCFHVAGSMVKALNPRGLKQCAPKDRMIDCSDPSNGYYPMARRNCSCFAQSPGGSPCLFGDMRPAKLLAIIAACRAAGVTHIIEQGRYGGLSAHMYALHGFKVTSVELLPLAEVSVAMRALAPGVQLVDADGRASVLELVRKAPASERLAVIFDGEKRQTAYQTFQLVKSRIALAAFDDTNLDDGAFPQLLAERGEAAWHTWDCDYMRRHNDATPLGKLATQLQGATGASCSRPGAPAFCSRPGGRMIRFHGGMEDLSRFHTTLVRGGAPWASAE